jgi:hypothetical protein
MNSGTAPLARQFVNNDNDYQREVALYVLGWAGDESDISILGDIEKAKLKTAKFLAELDLG